jgi:hypothetical protein
VEVDLALSAAARGAGTCGVLDLRLRFFGSAGQGVGDRDITVVEVDGAADGRVVL